MIGLLNVVGEGVIRSPDVYSVEEGKRQPVSYR
ncbi:unnamed protein product, partial [marine sediment metagenome]